MLWFLTLTQNCNLSCLYCGSGDNDDIEDISPHPKEISFPADNIKALARDKDPIICFYGGEPLLKMKWFAKVYDMVPHAKYILQTNATLLHRVSTPDLLKLDTILFSIDGDAAATDRNRGPGTYSKVLANVKDAHDRGFKGDCVARMTISDGSHIYEDVMHLLSCGNGAFDHVHWQLDVLWDSPKFARWEDFLGWRDNDYNPGITKLATEFREALADGKVLGIAPFLGILWSFLNDEPVSRIRCGAGSSAFNITTGGQVTACPIAPEIEPLGEFSADFEPSSVKDKVSIGGRCKSCDVLHECGGRCLYANKTDWWGDDGFEDVCQTIKYLLNEVRELVPHVRAAIEKHDLSLEDFHYPPFNNTVEIIP